MAQVAVQHNYSMKNNMNTDSGLIRLYPNAVPDQVCDLFVQFFEFYPQHHERVDSRGRPNFTQLNVSKVPGEAEVHSSAVHFFLQTLEQYKKDIGVRPFQFPDKHGWEQIRIKKYKKGRKDKFDEHVDVGNYETARRFLSLQLYLNDVDAGGETVFDDLSVTPTRGTMLIWPSLWTYPHRGLSAKSNDKYILSTYAHYL